MLKSKRGAVVSKEHSFIYQFSKGNVAVVIDSGSMLAISKGDGKSMLLGDGELLFKKEEALILIKAISIGYDYDKDAD